MGKPAARIGDMTAHGGSITVGFPTVLIGGMPAARLGDMHVCPMVTPGVPPIPHVGGPISLGSAGVLIGGMPAARMGDMAVCVGPPSSIVLGCMTVLIGETSGGGGGGGGGAGGGGGGGGDVAAVKAALISGAIAGKCDPADETKEHFLDAEFLDKAKCPVGGLQYKIKDPAGKAASGILSGEIKKSSVSEGSYEVSLHGIANVKWSVKEANVGDSVDAIVETLGIDDGTEAKIEIYIRDGNYTDYLLKTISSKVSGNKVQENWTIEVDEQLIKICDSKAAKKKFSQPFFFFKVNLSGIDERSGMLYVQDWTEVEVKDDDGSPIKNTKVKHISSSGECKEYTTDSSGKFKVEKIPPGVSDVSI